MFYGKFADEGDNYIYHIEGDNRLYRGLQPLETRSVLKIHFFPVRFCHCIFEK